VGELDPLPQLGHRHLAVGVGVHPPCALGGIDLQQLDLLELPVAVPVKLAQRVGVDLVDRPEATPPVVTGGQQRRRERSAERGEARGADRSD
jgi:hypothetical protein